MSSIDCFHADSEREVSFPSTRLSKKERYLIVVDES
jgi:hypothetical protein